MSDAPRKRPDPVQLKLKLRDGLFGFSYEWLPRTDIVWKSRMDAAARLLKEMEVISEIMDQMPACKCLNVFAAAINQRRELYQELYDQRRRMVPMPVNRINT